MRCREDLKDESRQNLAVSPGLKPDEIAFHRLGPEWLPCRAPDRCRLGLSDQPVMLRGHALRGSDLRGLARNRSP
jgi:hypothetical protein